MEIVKERTPDGVRFRFSTVQQQINNYLAKRKLLEGSVGSGDYPKGEKIQEEITKTNTAGQDI